MNRLKIGILDIFSVLVFFSCVEISYIIRVFHGQRYLFYMRCTLIVLLFIIGFLKKKKIFRYFNLITAWCILLVTSTAISGHDVAYAVQVVSIPYLTVLFLDCYSNKKDRILSVWKNILAVLVVIDMATIILVPQGLYNDGLQSLNWFLGYKTARFTLELPLCIISAYLSKKRTNKYSKETFFYLIVSLICTYKSKAAASFFCLVFLCALMLYIDRVEKLKRKKFFTIIFNYKYFVPAYVVALMLVFGIQKYDILQWLIVNVFHRSTTLTTRTYIWELMVLKIMQKPLIGFGILDGNTYTSITQNVYANSAHNLILAILMAGGIIGMLLYAVITILPLARGKGSYADCELPIIAGILIYLIVGITSESFLYSPFSFIMIELMHMNDIGGKGKFL